MFQIEKQLEKLVFGGSTPGSTHFLEVLKDLRLLSERPPKGFEKFFQPKPRRSNEEHAKNGKGEEAAKPSKSAEPNKAPESQKSSSGKPPEWNFNLNFGSGKG